MSSSAQNPRLNRLANETSPYLLQHKSNPVDWWPWGPEAFAEAQRTNRPILLSVGYAACHWCHVMAHESFEDEATAAVMNELFVNIKLDREERPDIDHIYMSALHLLGQPGGWPLTMFLTPKGEPVWGGTYFPNTARHGHPAFTDVLRAIARLFSEEPARVEHNRAALMSHLAARAAPEGRVSIGLRDLDTVAAQLLARMDPVHGGLRGAPKFPQSALFELLWRAGERGADGCLAAVELTLDRLCRGGIFDHLAGGFARYTVDERWLVPHFEKMLYDNAQILELLATAYARSTNDLHRDRAVETVRWLRSEMTTAQGAFASSLDADSDGEEGKYYVWSLEEIRRELGGHLAEPFATAHGVTAAGNWDGTNILNTLNDLPRNTDPDLVAARERLKRARDLRVRPGLDDKVLADWNGLMIAALARAAPVFGQPDWINSAARAFQFVAAAMTRGDRLGHAWRDERLVFPGLAGDYAAMIRAALALYEATEKKTYLDHAVAWQAALERHHADDATGAYFLAADDAKDLIVRSLVTVDDAVPNPTAIAAANLIRLSAFSGDDAYRRRADRLFASVLPLATENLLAHAGLLNALDLRLRSLEIVLAGQGDGIAALSATAFAAPAINRIVLRADALPKDHPAAGVATTDDAQAMVCANERCSLPVRTPAELQERIATALAAPPP